MMLCMEVTEVNDDVNDAMCEIANMIAGSFKQHLSKGGLDIRISTPSILDGVTTECSADNITLRFEVDEEWFVVSFSIED